MQQIEIDLTPKNFPRTEAAIRALFEAIQEESLSYMTTRELPPMAAYSICNALLFQTKREVEGQMAAFATDPVCISEVHAYKMEDGTIVPFATGPQITPIHNPHHN